MIENKMFCFQCQETAKGTGCTIKWKSHTNLTHPGKVF